MRDLDHSTFGRRNILGLMSRLYVAITRFQKMPIIARRFQINEAVS